MTTPWPDGVARVSAFLRDTGAEARLQEFLEGTETAEAAASTVGCSLAQIVKSLVLDCDGRPVLALVPGDRRADADKVARAVGAARARVAGPDRVREVTGFEPGAVAPFPLPGVQRVLIDHNLLKQELLWAGAGSVRHLMALPPAELVRLSRAEPAEIAVETPR